MGSIDGYVFTTYPCGNTCVVILYFIVIIQMYVFFFFFHNIWTASLK